MVALKLPLIRLSIHPLKESMEKNADDMDIDQLNQISDDLVGMFEADNESLSSETNLKMVWNY